MESRTAAPETALHPSGFFVSSYSVDGSNVDNSVKKPAGLEVSNSGKVSSANNSSSVVVDGDDDGGSENGGFVSGEEEFETALEKPVVVDSEEKAIKGDDSDAYFEDFLAFPMPKRGVSPIARVSIDDEPFEETEGDDSDADFEDPSVFPMPKRGVSPIARVSADEEPFEETLEENNEEEDTNPPSFEVSVAKSNLPIARVSMNDDEEKNVPQESDVMASKEGKSTGGGDDDLKESLGDGFVKKIEVEDVRSNNNEGLEGIGSREIASSGNPMPEQKGDVSNGEQFVETKKPSKVAEIEAKDPVFVQDDVLVKLSSGEHVNSVDVVHDKMEEVEVETKDPVPGENEDAMKLSSEENVTSVEIMDEKVKAIQTEKNNVDSDGEEHVEAKKPSNFGDVEPEGVKFVRGGDSILDDNSVETLKSGPIIENVRLENGFNQISGNAKGNFKQVKDNSEHETERVIQRNVETVELQPDGKEIDVDNVTIHGEEKADKEFDAKDEFKGKKIELEVDNIVDVVEHVSKGQETHEDVGVKDDSPYMDNVIVHNWEKANGKIEAKGEFEANKPELEVENVADVVEHVSSAKVDDENENGSLAVDSVAEQVQPDAISDAEYDKTPMTAHSEKLEEKGSTVEDNVKGGEEENPVPNEDDDVEGSDGKTEGTIFGSSEAARQFLEELEKASGGDDAHMGAGSSRDHSQRINGQIVSDSDEEGDDTDEEGEGKELFDSTALAALLKAATGADSDGSDSITITSQDGSKLFSVERPAGLGSSLRSLKPTARPNRTNLFTPSSLTTGGESETNLSEEEKKKLEKLQLLRVKFLRLVQRLGHSPEDSIAAQVLYRLALVGGRQSGQIFSLDAAKTTAMQLESEGKDDLEFSLDILVLGKIGVGKSATINSIFGEEKTVIDTFEPGTTSVKQIVGIVDGVKIRVVDTPGLKSSGMEQGSNRKVLSSIKRFIKKCPPDIVLYVDRLDNQTRDLNDLPLLRSVASVLGPSIWRSAIVTLTHAASAPPDGPSGSPLSYEVFVAQRSHVVQQSIGQAVGDLRLMNPSLMNPVSLVENHPACRKNRDGQKVLPNGQTWRPQLLLLCYSMKILAEASSLSKPQDPFDHKKLFGFRVRTPPLPYLLSWLLQSRTHPKLATDQGGDNGDSDVDLADLSDSDQEEDEDEYDQLPPFKPLRRSQLAKLSKEQRKAYFEEYDYRVKLLQKKQWREELRRMKEMKKNKGKVPADEYGYLGEDADQENGAPAAVSVPLPDMVLPPSFDSDNPAYRYRFLEPTSKFQARPVLDTHGWDHDCGYDGVNLEQSLAIASHFPAAVTVQVTKDKKEFNLHLDSSVAAKHGDNGSSMLGFDIQNVGKQLAYILRGETKFKNFKRNKTTAGASVTCLGENVATGLKLEDQIALGKRLMLVGSTGTVRSQGDAVYGANLEVQLRDADFPIGQDQSSLGLSLVRWRGDLALGANLQSQFSVGRNSKIAVRAGLNNKLSGQITVRTSTSDQLHIALLGILPVAMSIFKSIRPGISDNYSMY